jgi:ABC-2 type transport system permease protein
MNDMRTVLGAKSIVITKSLSDFRLHGVIKNLSSLVIFGCMAVGMFLLARSVTLFLIRQIGVGVEPLYELIAVVLFAFFVSAHFMSLILSFGTLYTAREVEFLQALPIASSTLFILRTGENVFASTGVLLLIGTAGVLGYGAVFQLAWYQYLMMMFLVMVPLVVIAGILGVLLLMVVILLAAKTGVRWMLATAIPIYAAVLFLSYRIADPVSIIREAVASAHGGSPVVAEISRLSAVWFPHGMAASALRGIVVGDHAGAFFSIAGLLGMLLVLAVIVVYTGSRFYYTTWLLVRELRGLHETVHRVRTAGLVDLRRRWTRRPNAEAVLKRDILQFLRDPVQRIHALMMAMLVVITVVCGGISVLPPMQTLPRALAIVTILLFDGFLVASITLRFVFPAVSQEGNAFWCVRTAPISLSRLYWMKFLLWVPIVLVPAEVLVWSTLPMARAPEPVMLASAGTMAFTVIGLVSINLGAGAYFATQREENPVKVAASQGASVTFLVSLLYLMVAATLLVLPVARVLGGAPAPQATGMLLNAVLNIAAASLCVAILANIVGIRALRKDF